MEVPSFPFLGAAAVAALLYALSPRRGWRETVLLIANTAFLLTFVHRPLEAIPYAAFVILGFGLVRMIGAGAPKAAYVASIVGIVAAFFWLKRYSFIPSALFLPGPYLLVGLSYVFFRVLHLAIDAREEPTIGRIGPVQYINYTLNFTALVSGPIQRYEDYRRTAVEAPAALRLAEAGEAIERVVAGLFKFMVVATFVSMAQKKLAGAFHHDTALTAKAADAALLTALYPIYLFFNFSGYTSFVIGVARFFRIELPENFNQPFRALSFIEYWNRWHMSLSNWLKTYVYNPLLMVMARRVTDRRLMPYLGAIALFVTFFLIGVWHGRTSNFFFFGILNGGGVAVNQAYRVWMNERFGRKRFAELGKRPVYQFVTRGLTFAWVGFTLLWFWSDWPELGSYAGPLGAGGLAVAAGLLLAGSCLGLGLLQGLRVAALRPGIAGQPILTSRNVRTVWVTLMLMAVFAVQTVMHAAAPDVVYKTF